MTAADFRRLALALPGAEQGAHMGATDFRVGGRIFATLAMIAQGFGNLMLTPEAQQEMIADAPDLFLPVHGGWGRMGATHIRLDRATESTLGHALRVAYDLRVERNRKPSSKKGTKRTALATEKKAAKKEHAQRKPKSRA